MKKGDVHVFDFFFKLKIDLCRLSTMPYCPALFLGTLISNEYRTNCQKSYQLGEYPYHYDGQLSI